MGKRRDRRSGNDVLNLDAEVVLQPFRQQRTMAGGGFALDTKQRHDFRLAAEAFDEFAAVEVGEALATVTLSESIAQHAAFTSRNVFCRVCLGLGCA